MSGRDHGLGEWTATWSDEVIILGAGFSRAMSTQFPLTDELGDEVLAGLRQQQDSKWLPAEPFTGGYFEAWLSSIAEGQPDLKDGDNEERHALFTRSVELIQGIIADRQRQAVGVLGVPDWLRRFVWLAHVRRPTVVTFNYDTAVEGAIDTAGLRHRPSSRPVTRDHVLWEVPRLPVWAPVPGPASPTFRLLKLHGSIDWYWVPFDSAGSTIQRAPDAAPAGLVPFLTPPAAAKSSFYANPVTRTLWSEAGDALGGARRVVLIGYSLPVTDLTVTGMLRRRLRNPEVEVVVVDRCPGPVSERLQATGVPAERISEFGGDHSVPDFVAAEEARTSRAVVVDLHEHAAADPTAPLVMGIGWHNRIVDEIQVSPEGPILVLSPHASQLAGRTDADPDGVTPGRTLRDLLDQIVAPDATIRVKMPDGSLSFVIAKSRPVDSSWPSEVIARSIASSSSSGRSANRSMYADRAATSTGLGSYGSTDWWARRASHFRSDLACSSEKTLTTDGKTDIEVTTRS